MTNNSFLGCAKLLYFIGESHCLPFRNILFKSSLDDIFLGRVRFQRVSAKYFTGEDESFHPDIEKALHAEQLLDDQQGPVHLAKDNQTRRIIEVSNIPAASPTLVLFAGDLDIVDIIRQMGANYDFELPDDPGYGLNKSLTPIPYPILNAQVTKLYRPFFFGCKKLKNMGFSHIMVHSLPPRVRDTDENDLNKKLWGGAEIQVRAKLTMLANRILYTSCKELDMPLIHIWDSITTNGYLQPNYCLDGVHLTRAAALLSFEQIVNKLQSQ